MGARRGNAEAARGREADFLLNLIINNESIDHWKLVGNNIYNFNISEPPLPDTGPPAELPATNQVQPQLQQSEPVTTSVSGFVCTVNEADEISAFNKDTPSPAEKYQSKEIGVGCWRSNQKVCISPGLTEEIIIALLGKGSIELLPTLAGQSSFKKRPYRYELMWTLHLSCEDAIRQGWNTAVNGSPPFKLTKKIKFVRESLKRWNKTVFGDLQRRKKNIEEELAQVQANIHSEGSTQKEINLRKEFETVLEQEHLHWMQKARSNWIVYGERNTRFFHVATKKRRRMNKIIRIKSMMGGHNG
ncbi:hypothetical protein COLO4_19647 [Corchorus olitorius]|uniref:Uncharacterized protein n=1 Tax=Corchorus olitorius TaxID=93759 RepID=A0A1R3J4F4_9ROSI|nr:hypothetical protein COLO4_19647 [Corchorus olitorius]